MQRPTKRVNHQWFEIVDGLLQDCLESEDRNTFKSISPSLSEYTSVISGFIKKCDDDFVPTKPIRGYPN